MRDFAYSVLSLQDISVRFNTQNLDEEKTIPINYRQNLFLIFKEAINNIAKHAQATEVSVLLENGIRDFIMKISDNGIGIDSGKNNNGNGLGNMEMRANRINAELKIISESGVEVLLKMKKL